MAELGAAAVGSLLVYFEESLQGVVPRAGSNLAAALDGARSRRAPLAEVARTGEDTLREVVGMPHSPRRSEAGILRPSRQVAELLAGTLQVPSTDRAAFVRYARGVAGHKSQVEDPNSEFRTQN